MSLDANAPAARAEGNANARRVKSRRRGNSIIELSFAMLVLFYLAMGMAEFGQFFFHKHTLQAAARDGCRTAILSTSTQSDVTAAVSAALTSAGIPAGKYTTTVTDPATSSAISNVSAVARGSGIKVTVTANFGDIGARVFGMIPANKQLVGTTTMVKE